MLGVALTGIIKEARNDRFCLTLSHQYIDQLFLPLRQTAFGNVGTPRWRVCIGL
jgi:hypothetical protein